jgi:hypothetical protein
MRALTHTHFHTPSDPETPDPRGRRWTPRRSEGPTPPAGTTRTYGERVHLPGSPAALFDRSPLPDPRADSLPSAADKLGSALDAVALGKVLRSKQPDYSGHTELIHDTGEISSTHPVVFVFTLSQTQPVDRRRFPRHENGTRSPQASGCSKSLRQVKREKLKYRTAAASYHENFLKKKCCYELISHRYASSSNVVVTAAVLYCLLPVAAGVVPLATAVANNMCCFVTNFVVT